MALYFTVDLPALARRVGYRDQLEDTDTVMEVAMAIEEHREQDHRRPRRAIPH
jgi:hypothetical protein